MEKNCIDQDHPLTKVITDMVNHAIENVGESPVRFIEDDKEDWVRLEIRKDFLSRISEWKTKLAETDLEKKLRLGLFREAIKRGDIK